MYKLDYEKEEQRCEDFFEKGDFIVSPDKIEEEPYYVFLWDNFKEALKFHKNHPEYFIYSLTEEEGMWIEEGIRYVNRMAYLFSKIKVSIPKNEPIMYEAPSYIID